MVIVALCYTRCSPHLPVSPSPSPSSHCIFIVSERCHQQYRLTSHHTTDWPHHVLDVVVYLAAQLTNQPSYRSESLFLCDKTWSPLRARFPTLNHCLVSLLSARSWRRLPILCCWAGRPVDFLLSPRILLRHHHAWTAVDWWTSWEFPVVTACKTQSSADLYEFTLYCIGKHLIKSRRLSSLYFALYVSHSLSLSHQQHITDRTTCLPVSR